VSRNVARLRDGHALGPIQQKIMSSVQLHDFKNI
jgi:hypothetical protein